MVTVVHEKIEKEGVTDRVHSWHDDVMHCFRGVQFHLERVNLEFIKQTNKKKPKIKVKHCLLDRKTSKNDNS